jgi:hypothetical protein
MTPEILDHRTGDRPKVDLVAAVERMLSHLPPGYFARLGHVALRDTGGLTRRERLRRKKADPGMVLAGTYTRPTSRDPAHIDLFVDSIVGNLSPRWLRVPPVRDLLLGRVLYHELGHHLHRVIRPEHRDLEMVADEWQKRLLREYFRRRYWYLTPIVRPLVAWSRRRKRRRERA